jgi:deazaflavin-dependent oxidoreductase (nitroreductase family)
MSHTATDRAHDHNRPGGFVPVPPSIIVKILMRPMTKLLNPIIGRFAGTRHFSMAAQIRHHGRRSGRAYMTPVTAKLAGDAIWIALTFGNQSDWSRNVRATGGCTVRLGGEDYLADTPQFINRADAGPGLRTAFKPIERAMFRLLGIKQFLRLRVINTRASQS